jgi:predicted secreted protein
MRFSTTLLLVAISIGGQYGATAAEVALTLSESDNGHEVRVHVGQHLRVSLLCSPSTGYSWRLIGEPGPQLSLVSSGMTGKNSDTLGAPQRQDFLFAATSNGIKHLRFEYKRPWDGPGTAPIKTFSVTARIGTAATSN